MKSDKVVTDPTNSMKVRFTDNGIKDKDYYPEDQIPKPLFLDPYGAPYALYNDPNSDISHKQDPEV